MKPLGYYKRHLTACEIVGRKHLCAECASEAKLLKEFPRRSRQKRLDRIELRIAEEEMAEERAA